MQISLILKQRSPKITQTRKILYHFSICDNRKIPSCTYYFKEADMKIAMFAQFKEYRGNHKNLFPRTEMFWGKRDFLKGL